MTAAPPFTAAEQARLDAIEAAPHRMLPGSHERSGGAECVCGAEWSRWAGRCAAAALAVVRTPVDGAV